MIPIPPPTEIDKAAHYGRYQAHESAQKELALKVAHKALDIPQDDMHIQADKTVTNTGMSPAAVVGIAAVAGLVPTVLAGIAFLRQGSPGPAAPVVAPAAQEWEFQIYRQKDGKWEAKTKE